MKLGSNKTVTSASGEVVAPRGVIRMIVPTDASAFFKAKSLLQNYDLAPPYQPDDFCIGANYETGTGRESFEVIFGEWSKITVTSGAVVIYFW